MDLTPAQLTQLRQDLRDVTEKLRDAIGRCATELSRLGLYGKSCSERFGVRIHCRLYQDGTVRVNNHLLAEMSREELCVFADELPDILRMAGYSLDRDRFRTQTSLEAVERILKSFTGA